VLTQLETPPENLKIRGLEEVGVKKALNYLINMPDPDKKMTLYAMPKGYYIEALKLRQCQGEAILHGEWIAHRGSLQENARNALIEVKGKEV